MKFFKPITEAQKAASEEITKGLKPIEAGIEGLRESVRLPNYLGIELDTSEKGKITMGEGDEKQIIGPLAFSYLSRFGEKEDVDKTYGLYSKNKKIYIGNKKVEINNDDITINNKTYKGTEGLWELITSKDPDMNIVKEGDINNYGEIVIRTGTIYRNNDSNNIYPKSSRGKNWRDIVKPIWEVIKPKKVTGKGIIIPCDPNALVQRLDLLLASKASGNTGVRNEIVSVCDELKRQGHLDEKSYKKLMSIL